MMLKYVQMGLLASVSVLLLQDAGGIPADCRSDEVSALKLTSLDIHDVFRNPSREARLQMWYHWIGDCVTEEGIVSDIKAMSELGVGAAHIFAPSMACLPIKAKPMDAEWMRLFSVAIREAKKYDIDLGFHNCPGWSSSGGPWITPENSMKVVVSSSVDVNVGRPVANVRLPQPRTECGYYRDIAVLAFPIPEPVPLSVNPFPQALGIADADRTGVFELDYVHPVRARYLRFKTRDARLCARLQVEAWTGGAGIQSETPSGGLGRGQRMIVSCAFIVQSRLPVSA